LLYLTLFFFSKQAERRVCALFQHNLMFRLATGIISPAHDLRDLQYQPCCDEICDDDHNQRQTYGF